MVCAGIMDTKDQHARRENVEKTEFETLECNTVLFFFGMLMDNLENENFVYHP